MYERAIREYKHYAASYGQNVCIFILVGSFYEIYDLVDPKTGEGSTSMKRAVDILGIALKVKKEDGPRKQDGLFAGFPESQLHKFAALLTRENWTVVVIDQVKNTAGKVLQRTVARILSPATHIEAAGNTDSLFLAGVWLHPGEWSETGATSAPTFGAAALDLTTGKLYTYEGATVGNRESWSSDELFHFFQVHTPKELVLWWDGAAMEVPEETFLRRAFGLPFSLFHRRVAGPVGSDLVREDLFRRCFQPKSVLPIREVVGLTGRPLTEKGLAALLLFVEEHFPSAMNLLHSPEVWNPKSSVFLGNHALTQLNMVTPNENDSVLALFLKTYTQMGRRGIRHRLLYPVCAEDVLERRYDEVEWAAASDDAGPTGILRQIQDLAKLHRKISTASVNAVDVLGLDMSYKSVWRLADSLAGTPLEMPQKAYDELMQLFTAFRRVFSIEKAKEASEDMFCLTAEAGPKCATIEDELKATHTEISSTYSSIVEWLGETKENLRLEFKDSSVILCGGRTLMMRAEKKLQSAMGKDDFPAFFKGVQVHAKKVSNSMEVPVLNMAYAKILRLRGNLANAVREELLPVCMQMAEEYTGIWDELEAWVSNVDCSFTIARVAKERGLCRPSIAAAGADASSFLNAVGLRHPLIEGQQTRTEYVKHTVSLGESAAETGWLIYGMNASGKSSLMKSVGIAVLLAQAGCFVPAASFTFRPFTALFTRILNTDNLWAGLSSFAVEMTELREILAKADGRSLVLGDEVCSGTESVSATALVGASLEWLAGRGAKYMFATHLHSLQSLPRIMSLPGLKVWHLRVRYDAAADRLIYDRTLHPGAGSSLYGLEVAKAMAIPHAILEAAHTIRKELTGVATEADAPASEWNRALQRRACELCGCNIVRDLEVHHIQPRASASAVTGKLADGSTHMNNLRNLIVVCQKCHDAHHAGEIEIGPLKMTSDGLQREIVRGSAAGAKKPAAAAAYTEEEMETIQEALRKYKHLPPSRVAFDLEADAGIKITVQKLRAIRASMQ